MTTGATVTDLDCDECGIATMIAMEPGQDGGCGIYDGHTACCRECRAMYMWSCDAEEDGYWTRREDWDGPRKEEDANG